MPYPIRQLRPLFPFFRPYTLQLVAGLMFVVASSAITSVIPWLMERAIDGMRAGATTSATAKLAGAMVVVALVGGGLRYGMRELMNGLSRWVEYDLRNVLFRHLEALDASYYNRTRTGDIMARLTNDLAAVRMAAGPAIMYLANTVLGSLFALGFMSHISVKLTMLALIPMIPLPILTVKLGHKIHTRFESVQEHFSTLTTHAQENLSGVRVVRAYQQERAEVARFHDLSDEYVRRNMSLVRLWGTLHPMFALLAGAGAVVVLGVGGSMALRGAISVGAFVAFGMYLVMLTWPLIAFGWVINLFQRGAASMGRLDVMLQERPRITTEQPVAHLPSTTAGRAIEFRGVGFHYPVADGTTPRWVLRDISFTVAAGMTLGVVGATGSGKSALIDLLARVYDPQEGDILIDGVSIRHLPVDELRRAIGYVPQESVLFSDTIATNLQYGIAPVVDTDDDRLAATDTASGSATVDGSTQDAWRVAARIAQLDEAVSDFPGGYDTMLGERGINLSGGQKQRAALARALARRPSIVLLDDALSAVDTHTEAEILHGLSTALAGRTAIIASHRASALRDAASIIVLDGGRIVERGTSAELLTAEGRYWSLVRRQRLVEEVVAGV